MSGPPVLDFGSPSIFFDSHPEEQDTYIQSYWTALKSTFKIAFTGQVPKFHEPGKLRIIWWTQEGNEGMKDYEMHEYALVRDNFDALVALPEVRRVIVMGYSGQNPYVIGDRGRNPWREKFDRDLARIKKEQKRMEASSKTGEKPNLKAGDVEKITHERMDASKEGREGKAVDMSAIEKVIENGEREEEEMRRLQQERIAKETDGLLDGDMV